MKEQTARKYSLKDWVLAIGEVIGFVAIALGGLALIMVAMLYIINLFFPI